MINLFRIALFFTLLLSFGAQAQNGVTYKIEGNFIHATINLKQPTAVVDSIIKSFGFESLLGIESQKSTMGWTYKDQTATSLHLVLDKNHDTKELPNAYTIGDVKTVDIYQQTRADYGVNSFKERSVFTRGKEVVFTLKGYPKAKQVYLSGTFNGWSTLATPMKKTENGWEVLLPLRAGKHVYKFIVDGAWMPDPQNNKREDDGNGGHNSVYYVANYTFALKGFSDAKKVSVSGSFNNWQPLNLLHDKASDRWYGTIYLREGTHAYKFQVDGKWILDPDNKVIRPDGMGNLNSFTSVGATFYFVLPGFFDAKKVTVAGDFNAWNFEELTMLKTKRGWVLPYVLPAGNFEYKFRVDGAYVLDPSNPIRNGEKNFTNNVLCVEPNQMFMLRGYSQASEVLLSGTFNNWSTSGYTMQRVDGAWRISIHLPYGKHLYKFVVDGKWINDPENPLWEQNEVDSKNSIIWVNQ
jgi:hypothetical protein